jgi:hypothetical protein
MLDECAELGFMRKVPYYRGDCGKYYIYRRTIRFHFLRKYATT